MMLPEAPEGQATAVTRPLSTGRPRLVCPFLAGPGGLFLSLLAPSGSRSLGLPPGRGWGLVFVGAACGSFPALVLQEGGCCVTLGRLVPLASLSTARGVCRVLGRCRGQAAIRQARLGRAGPVELLFCNFPKPGQREKRVVGRESAGTGREGDKEEASGGDQNKLSYFILQRLFSWRGQL